MRAYFPFCASSASCVPRSTTLRVLVNDICMVICVSSGLATPPPPPPTYLPSHKHTQPATLLLIIRTFHGPAPKSGRRA